RREVACRLGGLEQDECLGEWFEPMWGTVHADTRITLPRDRWSQINDLSLLRFGGYPFGVHADLADTLFVLRDNPGSNELQVYLWLAAELGRVTRGDRYAYQVTMGQVDKSTHQDLGVVPTTSR
nr:cellulose biosynthesis cyclic di-GMP-binding regulatory protein BcsB [bacterium]